MGKALIIKNDANFASQAVTKITFSDPTPCTGISFASETITIAGYDPVTIGYTVTPPDTTDPIVWESSDTSVVTVSGGVLTVVGVGTATITATCGSFSASANVTVNIAYNPNYQFYQTANASGKSFLSASYARSRISAFGTGDQAGVHNIPDSTSGGGALLYPIKIPQNIARIKVDVTEKTNFYNAADSAIRWLSDEACGDSNLPNAALYIDSTLFNPRSNTPLTVNIPSGADCFVIYLKLSSTQAEGVIANDYAVSSGISIEFLTSE